MLKAIGEVAGQDSSVSFIVYGTRLELDGITRNLGLSPLRTHRVGDLDILGKPYLQDMWLLDSPLEESADLNAHLMWLGQQLEPHYEYIRSLKTSAELRIYCAYHSDSDQSGFSISPEALSIFTKLGIPMEVSILCL